jgi:hypothetical protein
LPAVPGAERRLRDLLNEEDVFVHLAARDLEQQALADAMNLEEPGLCLRLAGDNPRIRLRIRRALLGGTAGGSASTSASAAATGGRFGGGIRRAIRSATGWLLLLWARLRCGGTRSWRRRRGLGRTAADRNGHDSGTAQDQSGTRSHRTPW